MEKIRIYLLPLLIMTAVIPAQAYEYQVNLDEYEGVMDESIYSSHFIKLMDNNDAYVTFRSKKAESGNLEFDQKWLYRSSYWIERNNVTIMGEECPVVGVCPYLLGGESSCKWFASSVPLKDVMQYAFADCPTLLVASFANDVDKIREYAFAGSNIGYFVYGYDPDHNNESVGVTIVPDIESLKVFDGVNLERLIVSVPNDEMASKFKAHPVWRQLNTIKTFEEIEKGYAGYYLPAPFDGRCKWTNHDNVTYRINDSNQAISTYWNYVCAEHIHNIATPFSTDYPEEFIVPETIDVNGVNCTVTHIGRYTCCNSPVAKAILPATVVALDNRAFYGAQNLSEVRLGRGLLRIGERAFEMCPELRRIESWAVVPPVFADEFAFAGTDKSLITLAVPDEALEAYRHAPVWRDLGRIIGLNEIYGSVSEAVADDSTSAPAIYDLGGRQVGTDTDNLDAGIYIKRDAEGTGKIVVR